MKFENHLNSNYSRDISPVEMNSENSISVEIGGDRSG
jgi:hypothetical protein